MRLSHLFFTTLRDDPADVEMPSHRLLLRAGYIRPLGVRDLLAAAAGQARQRPRRADHPRGAGPDRRPGDGDAGRPSGGRLARSAAATTRSARSCSVQGPQRRDMVLAMTHEEVVAILLADIVEVYRQLPMHGLPLPDEVARRAAVAGRPDPRPRVRDEGRLQLRPRRRPGLDKSYRDQYEAYVRTFERLGLEHDRGRRPTSGSWAARRPTSSWSSTRVRRGHPRPVRRRAATPRTADRRDPQRRLPRPRTAAADRGRRDPRHDDDRRPSPRSSSMPRDADGQGRVLHDRRWPASSLRSSAATYDVNETKLVNAVEASSGLRPATVEEIKAAGMEPGYGSPIGAHDTIVVVDELVARSPNLVAGREPRRLPLPERQRRPRLQAGRHRRHHERPRGRSVHRLRVAA